MTEQVENLLEGFRALDLTDEKGAVCGKWLADQGVDVIKVEKPGGNPSRDIAPFYKDIPDREKSLCWFAFNVNKRGITLNIETVDGQEIFKKLVKAADFVIESFEPGYLDELGLGYETLSDVNPRVILISITPFGQTGPYAHWKGCDLVCAALSGYASLCGDPDRAPVRASIPQTYAATGYQAAYGAMVAHYYRQKTGVGQHVDVSIQEANMVYFMDADGWDFVGSPRKRTGRILPTTHPQRVTHKCKDGAYLSYNIFFGPGFGHPANMLIKWMDELGIASDQLKKYDFERIGAQSITKEQYDEIIKEIQEKLFDTHTAKEIYNEAVKRGINAALLNTAKDALENPQLAARGYWVKVEHPELGDTLTYAGSCVKRIGAPYRVRRRSPHIGEHNKEVYMEELGMSREELVLLKQGGVI